MLALRIGWKKILYAAIFILHSTALMAQADRLYLAGWYTGLTGGSKLRGFQSKGVNLVLPYWSQYWPGKIPEYLTQAQQLGIKVIVEIPRDATGRRDDGTARTADLQRIKDFVNKHKSHPAVYGWNSADEPEFAWEHRKAVWASPENMKNVYDAIKQADPDHPVCMVNWAGPRDYYANACDIMMVDWYPRDTKRGANDKGEFNWMVRQSYAKGRKGMDFIKKYKKDGFIFVPLGSGEGHEKQDAHKGKGYRALTYNEYRFHIFSVVVQGAMGTLYWWESWATEADKNGVYKMISETQVIGNEMNNGTTNDSRISVNQSSDRLIYRYGIHDNRHVLLAVNIAGWNDGDWNVNPAVCGSKLANVKFSLPNGIRPSQITVLDENRTIPVSNGTFTDSFNRFEVHIYEFKETASLIGDLVCAGERVFVLGNISTAAQIPVYNTIGQIVSQNSPIMQRTYSAEQGVRGSRSSGYRNGIHFVRIKQNGQCMTRRLVLLR